ncbi:serine-rich adhesin for platelets-like [Ptychodera flava]|uniref:serine-rich adhesin for platelets-like n=1 Tax=Ptychodera flava TaxID=63121 RepID=UPI00396A3C75
MDNSEFSELSELQPCFMVMNSQPEESQNLGHKQYHQQQIRKLTALCDNQSSSIHTPMASQEHGKDKESKQEEDGRAGNHDNISACGHDDSGSGKVQDGTDCHVDASHSFDKSPSVNANPSSSSKRGHLNQDYHTRSNQHHDNSSLTTTSSSISSSIYPGTTSIESATTSLGSFTSVTSPTHLNPNKDDAGLATGKINRLENQDKEVEVIVIPSQDDGITASQHDMFDEEDNQDASQKDRHVNTPSTTVAALHLSGGTFVHETETSASDDCIPPTPDAFGPAPIMIPDSPTDGIAEEDDKSVAKVDDDTYIDSDEEIQIPRWQQVLNEEQKALRTISSTAATTTSTGSDSDKSSNTKDTTSKSKETNSQSTSLQAWQSSLPLAITTDDSSISKSASLGTKKDVSNRTSDQRSLEKGNASQNSEKTSAVKDPMGRCVDGTKDPGHRSLMRMSQRHGSQNEETKTGSQEGLRVLGPEEPDMSEDPFRIPPSHRANTDGGNECNETRIEEAETVEGESMRLHLSASAAMTEQSVQPMDQGPDESENQQCEMEIGDSLTAVAAENKKDGVTGQDGGKIIEDSSHGTEDWGLCLSPSQGDTESQAAVGLRVAKNFGSSSRLDESINSEDMAIPQFQNTSAVSDKNDSERKSPSQSLLTKTNISGIKDKTERCQSGNDSFHGHHSDNKQRRLFDTEKTTPNQAARNTPLVSPVEETSMPTDGRNSQASERTETPIGVEVSDITGTSDNMTTTPNPTAVTSGNNDSEKNQGTEQSGGFQFNIPTEGLLLRPVVSVTPPSVKQRKRQPRHSTPLAPSKQTADAKTSDRTEDMMDQFTNKKEEEQIGRKKASVAESAALQGSTAKLTSLKVGFVAPSQESSDTPVFHLQKPESVPEDGVAVSVKTTESVFTKIKEFKELKTVETQKSQPSQCSEDPFEFKVLREKKSERKEKSRHDCKEKFTKTNTMDQARIEGNGLKAKVQEEKRNDQVEEMDVDGFEGNVAAETVESEDLFASQPIERRQRRKAVKLTDSQESIEQNQKDLQNINQGDSHYKEECHDGENTELISMEVVSEIPDKSQSRSKIKTIGTTAPRDPYDFSDSQSNKVPTPKKLHPANLGNDIQEQPQTRTRGRAPSGGGGNNNGSDGNEEDENERE